MLNQDYLQRLGGLLDNLYLCTGIKFALLDSNAKEVYASSFKTKFCSLIESSEGGYQRCVACDDLALVDVRKHGKRKRYLCHAGLYELAMPVVENGKTIAIILYGQVLDDAPRAEQWERVSSACSWYPDQAELYQAFLKLNRMSAKQMSACMEIVRACLSEARIGCLMPSQRDDAQLLKSYIDAHFDDLLTTESLCNALNVGKTKLYELCNKHYQLTPMQIVTNRRIEAARDMLENSKQSIRDIANAVGIPDENYFTKVFKKHEGITPSQYRKNSEVVPYILREQSTGL